jgi:hypothetical protein
VENSVIAVQIANGTFVPVLDTSSRKRRRLVVTTVRDNQENVKIELFRGSDESMADPEYVGSLVIDNIEPAERGAPDVSVLLGVDESGNLNATATDTQSGEYQSLSVSLEQLDAEGGYDVPDFQLSDGELTLDDLSLDDEDSLDDLSLDDLSLEEEPAGLGDFADEEVSFDESFSTEGDLSAGDLTEDDFDLGSLAEDLSDEESGPPQDLSIDSELDAGMVEADLGDEDFTFDEGVQDEPLFPDAAAGELEDDDFPQEQEELGEQLEDTLSHEEFERLDSEPVTADEPETGDTEAVVPRRSNAIVFVGYLILALAALAVLTYLVFRLMEGPPAPPLRAGLMRGVSLAAFFLGVPRSRRAPRG